MIKLDTHIYEYAHCGECPNTSHWYNSSKKERKCIKTERIIPDLWRDIPDWCPLETKEVKNG